MLACLFSRVWDLERRSHPLFWLLALATKFLNSGMDSGEDAANDGD